MARVKTQLLKFARPIVAAQVAAFALRDDTLRVLLVEREHEPYEGAWQLPGGPISINETLAEGARRWLQDQGGVRQGRLGQVATFDGVKRDVRGRVIAVLHVTMLPPRLAAKSTRGRGWFAVNGLPPMAFDHAEMVARAWQHLKLRVCLEPAVFELLPDRFSLTQVQAAYETILQEELDKRNFRRKITRDGLVRDTGEKEQGTGRRPAALYEFDGEQYRRLVSQGWQFRF